jgi:VanZ family protein
MKIMSDSTTSSIVAGPLSGEVKPRVVGFSSKQFSSVLNGGMRLASLLLLVYWISIFVGTHLPGHSVPKVGLSDKSMHFGAFVGLAFLLAWAIPTRKGHYARHGWMTFGVIAGYACLDELTQKFIPGRSCSLWDLLADLTGAAFGIGLYWICRYFLLRREFGRLLIRRLS